MQTLLLPGPAGSGKTFRIVSEIASELRQFPEGKPLLLLAPKQSTYQLERQILATGEVKGYTRLQVLSFERLAQYVFEQSGIPQPDLLSESTRQMVLTSILKSHHAKLQYFAQCWNQTGFVALLSRELSALQMAGRSPGAVRDLAETSAPASRLQRKLNDLALILELYTQWTSENKISDAHDLLTLAADALNEHFEGVLFQKVWMDGFGEVSHSELDFLIQILKKSEDHLLAFCLDKTTDDASPWLSPWLVAASSFDRLLGRIRASVNSHVRIEWLRAGNPENRFSEAPLLQSLERSLAHNSHPSHVAQEGKGVIELIQCENREEESRMAARAILQHVQKGGKYRDCAVLVRNLQPFHTTISRIFTEYGIPFFLDRRKPIRHHPLVRLTETALELAAFGWSHARWFAFLKTNLTRTKYPLDTLETEALRLGWQEKHWLHGFENGKFEELEKVRVQQMELLENFHGLLGEQPDGTELAKAFEKLWSLLQVREQLAKINDENLQRINETVWKELEAWLKGVQLAFRHQRMSLKEWVSLLEIGLSGLSVGLIPPTLDEVLVGAVDRSRNSELSLVCVLGLNEGLFPALPPTTRLITENELLELNEKIAGFQKTRVELNSLERFYFYIGVTRSREKVVVTYAQEDEAQAHLNSSVFLHPLKRLIPGQSARTAKQLMAEADVHTVEPIRRIVQSGGPTELQRLIEQLKGIEFPGVTALLHSRDETSSTLGPKLAQKLFGPVIKSSISKLELFSACHFQFFVDVGLKGREREILEFDARNKGTYQHLILSAFHDLLVKLGLRWSDVNDDQIKSLLNDLFKHYDEHFKQGLVNLTPFSRLEHKAARTRLTSFVLFLADWTRRSRYQPLIVETGFGISGKSDCDNNVISLSDGREVDITRKDLKIPPWHLDLGNGKALELRGVIDSVGGWTDEDGQLHFVILDFKSSSKSFDNKKFINALQIQLPAYMAAVIGIPEFSGLIGAATTVPAGMFYGNLRGDNISENRRDWMEEQQSNRFVLSGRFNKADEGSLETSEDRKNKPFLSSRNYKLENEEFQQLLTQTKEFLESAGREILNGSVAINPFRDGNNTACVYCKYLTVCRIDELAHEFRSLKQPPEIEKKPAPVKAPKKKTAKTA